MFLAAKCSICVQDTCFCLYYIYKYICPRSNFSGSFPKIYYTFLIFNWQRDMYKYTSTCACMHSKRTFICTVRLYVVIHFCYSVRLFEWKWINASFELFAYIYIVIGHPIIRRGCDPINRFKLATFLYLSHVRAWMLNAICRGLFVLSDLKRVRFVGIGEIVDNRCLNFLLIILLTCVAIIFNDRVLVYFIIICKSKVS